MGYLHPRGGGGIETRVEGDRVVDVRTQSSGHVQNRNFGRPDVRLAGGIQLARDAQVRPAHVRIDKQREIDGIDVVFEILAIDVDQIVVSLFRQLQPIKKQSLSVGQSFKKNLKRTFLDWKNQILDLFRSLNKQISTFLRLRTFF